MKPKYLNTCPTCGAQPGQQCRTLTTGKITDAHMARVDAQFQRSTDDPGLDDRLVALRDRHRWDGGYLCACGHEINTPQTWSYHVLEEAYAEFVSGPAAQQQPETPLMRTYACMCGAGRGRGGCGCRLTNPPSYWGTDGQRHFYDEPEPRVPDAQVQPDREAYRSPPPETADQALERAARAVEVERDRRWVQHLRDHPLSEKDSCPADYAVHDALEMAVMLIRNLKKEPQ